MSDHKICHDCDNGFDTPLYTTDTCKDFVKIKCTTWSTDPISCLNIKTGDHGDIVIRKMADAICKLTNGETGTPNLQAVTNVGNTTSLPIVANTFVTGSTVYGNNITIGNTVLTYPANSGVIPTSVNVNGSNYVANSDGVINLGVLLSPTPNLQQVTNVGRDTTNPIQLVPNSGHGLEFGYISNPDKLFLGLGDLTEHQDLFFPDFTGVLATSVNNRLADGKGNVDLPISFIQNGLIEGGYVTWTGQGYTYEVSPALYVINGQTYRTTKPSFITLDPSDPTNSRIDIIGVNDQGEVIKVMGIASPDPVAAQIDYLHELSLTTILLLPNSATPQVGEDIIYNENIEWTGTSIGVTANFDNLTNTFVGTKSINVPAITDGDYIKFLRSSSIAVADWDSVKFSIQLKSKLGRKTGISIAFYDNDSRVTNLVPLSLAFGLDVNNISTYQTIVVPFNSLTFSTTTFNSFRIIFRGNNTGVYVDNIRLQGGIVQPVPNNDDLILTTNGSSGPATLNNNILNIPNYNTGGGGGSAYVLPIASDTVLGGVKVGNGLSIDATTGVLSTVPVSPYTLPIASNAILGGIKIGTTLSIDVDGVVNVIPSTSYTLPIASTTVLGGIKVGNNLSIDNNGVLSATSTPIELTTNGTTGAATFINNILNIPTPTPYILPTASTSVLGGVKVGTNLSIDGAGVLSASFTTPALQAVTDVGNSTTNNILINKNDGLLQVASTTTDAIARIGADTFQGGYLELGSLNTYRSFLYNNAGSTQNTVLKFPNYPSAIIPVSVNGQFADLSGNITLSIDAGSDPVRFGIEDNLGLQNRSVDLSAFNFDINTQGDFNFILDGLGIDDTNNSVVISGVNKYFNAYFEDSINSTYGTFNINQTGIGGGSSNFSTQLSSSIQANSDGTVGLASANGISQIDGGITLTPDITNIFNKYLSNHLAEIRTRIDVGNIPQIYLRATNGDLNKETKLNVTEDSIWVTVGNLDNKQTFSNPVGGGDHYIPLSVNGNFADSTGNITLDLGSGGGGSVSRFGIEDNVINTARTVQINGNNGLTIYNGDNIGYFGSETELIVYPENLKLYSQNGTNGENSGAMDVTPNGWGATAKNSTQSSNLYAVAQEVSGQVQDFPNARASSFQLNKDFFNITFTGDDLNRVFKITPTEFTLQRSNTQPVPVNIPLSVNGTFADSSGNITISTGGGGTTLSLTTTGTSGASTYNSGAGVLNIPNYTYTLPIATSSVLGGIKVGSGLSINGSGVLSADYTGWSTSGNSLAGNPVNTTTEFLGTTNTSPLILKTNNTNRLVIDSDGYVTINASTGNTVYRLIVGGAINATSAGFNGNVGGNSGTFTSNIVTPAIYGSFSGNGTLLLTGNAAASGNTATNTSVIFKANNNNAVTSGILLNNGSWSFGSSSAPHASAVHHIYATTQGSVPAPVMTKAQRDAITSPTDGLQVKVSDNGGYLSFYNAATSNWQKVTSIAD